MRAHSAAAIAWLAIASLSLGCLGPRVYTDHDPSIDLASLQTFRWLEPPLRVAPREEGAPTLDPFVHNTLLDKRVRDAVETALAARGYRKADGDMADFAVRYEVVSREVVRDSPVYVGGGYGYRYYGGGAVYANTTTYQEGTLILDVIDPKSDSIAWRGWSASRTRDGHIDADLVSRTVEAIVTKFPPGGAAPAEEAGSAPESAPE
jgi:hypothetical protein